MGEPRSRKQQCAQVVGSLRGSGASWVEVAAALRRRYRVNARVAFRLAHGWSQREAAEEWNRRWPDELKTFKSFSYWELWPGSTGHAPSFDALAKLARLYECAVSDLLVDLPDFRHLDTGGIPAGSTVPSGPLPDALAGQLMRHLGSLAGRDMLGTPRERDRAYDRLVGFLQSWAHTMDRRDALRVLGWAASAAAALPALDSDAHQRLVSVLATPHRVDTPTVEHIEAVLWRCKRQDYALGPQAALDTVLAQRDLARTLLPDCPPTLRPRMLSALSEASRQAGWLSFDLNRFDHAGYYYEHARTLAHEAENTALGAYVLCYMSHLATWRGMSRTGIDHAVAAGQWAQHTDDIRLRAYAADLLARAYAADGQRDGCLTALDTAYTALTATDHAPSLSDYGEPLHIAIRGACHLKLRDSERAAEYLRQSLGSLDHSYTRNMAMTLIDLGTAYAQGGEIDEAARLFGDAGDIAARNSSARLAERLTQGRAELEPWKHTTAVRQLDDRLATVTTA